MARTKKPKLSGSSWTVPTKLPASKSGKHSDEDDGEWVPTESKEDFTEKEDADLTFSAHVLTDMKPDKVAKVKHANVAKVNPAIESTEAGTAIQEESAEAKPVGGKRDRKPRSVFKPTERRLKKKKKKKTLRTDAEPVDDVLEESGEEDWLRTGYFALGKVHCELLYRGITWFLLSFPGEGSEHNRPGGMQYNPKPIMH